MYRILFFLVIIFSFFCSGVKAQTQGCLVANIVYTTTPKAGNYSASGSKTPLASGYCSWTPTTGTSCIVCFPNLNPGGNCSGMSRTSQTGISNTFTMVLCPLDSYVFLLAIVICGIVSFFLRKSIF